MRAIRRALQLFSWRGPAPTLVLSLTPVDVDEASNTTLIDWELKLWNPGAR